MPTLQKKDAPPPESMPTCEPVRSRKLCISILSPGEDVKVLPSKVIELLPSSGRRGRTRCQGSETLDSALPNPPGGIVDRCTNAAAVPRAMWLSLRYLSPPLTPPPLPE